MKVEVTGCYSCPLRQASHMSRDSSCGAAISKRHPVGRDIPYDLFEEEGRAPDWCPADTVDGVHVTLVKNGQR